MILMGAFTSLLFFTTWRWIFINKQKKTADTLINDQIRCKEMLVITDKGEKLGVLSRQAALDAADNHNLDLVLVSPEGNPPVAKLMDYSRFRFEQQKKLKEMKKNQKVVVVQEIQLSPTIEKHDFDTSLIEFESIRSRGNGGQNINKVETAIRATYKPTGDVVVCMEERTQYLNKQKAINQLRDIISNKNSSIDLLNQTRDWKKHTNIQRGNPVATFVGTKFEIKKA